MSYRYFELSTVICKPDSHGVEIRQELNKPEGDFGVRLLDRDCLQGFIVSDAWLSISVTERLIKDEEALFRHILGRIHELLCREDLFPYLSADRVLTVDFRHHGEGRALYRATITPKGVMTIEPAQS